MNAIPCTGPGCALCRVTKFQPPIGADPRYVGDLPRPYRTEIRAGASVSDSIDAVRYALGNFTNEVKKQAAHATPCPPGTHLCTRAGTCVPRTAAEIGAELAALEQRQRALRAQLSNAIHEETGKAIMMTCPDGSRHKWRCKEYSTTTHYTPSETVRRRGKYVCPCGATATID